MFKILFEKKSFIENLFGGICFACELFILVLSDKNTRSGKSMIKKRILDANAIIIIIQLNSRNVQNFSLFNIWLDIKTITLFLSFNVLKMLTILIYIYIYLYIYIYIMFFMFLYAYIYIYICYIYVIRS